MSRKNARPSLEIIIPLYNEAEMVSRLVQALSECFSPTVLEQADICSIHYLLVDDGSKDLTASLLFQEIKKGFPGTVIRLSRNFGHQNALSAGLANSRGDLVAIIDADLQDPPEIILKMIEKWRDGFDVVYGQRRKRKENFLKRAGYWAFYRLLAGLADISVPLDSGDFCLMGSNVVSALNALPENQRFIRGLRAWVGFPQTGLEYERPPRCAGVTKYSWGKLYRLATDGVASSSIRPLKVAQVFGFTYAFLSVILFVAIVFLILQGEQTENQLSFLILSLLVLSGNSVLCICLYIMGAYVGRGFLETKQRPSYIIMEKLSNPETASQPSGESGDNE